MLFLVLFVVFVCVLSTYTLIYTYNYTKKSLSLHSALRYISLSPLREEKGERKEGGGEGRKEEGNGNLLFFTLLTSLVIW